MESIKRIGKLGRQHYEKILLLLAVIALGGAVWYLYLQSLSEKDKIDEYFKTKTRQKVKAVESVDLTAFEKAKQSLEQPQKLELGLPHNLLNPVKWQRRPDKELVKITGHAEVGPAAAAVTNIRPLYLTIAVDRAAGSGWWIVVTNEVAPTRAAARVSQFASLSSTNTRVFILREAKPPDNPTEWIVELRDTGQKVSFTKEKPYQRVEG